MNQIPKKIFKCYSFGLGILCLVLLSLILVGIYFLLVDATIPYRLELLACALAIACGFTLGVYQNFFAKPVIACFDDYLVIPALLKKAGKRIQYSEIRGIRKLATGKGGTSLYIDFGNETAVIALTVIEQSGSSMELLDMIFSNTDPVVKKAFYDR